MSETHTEALAEHPMVTAWKALRVEMNKTGNAASPARLLMALAPFLACVEDGSDIPAELFIEMTGEERGAMVAAFIVAFAGSIKTN